MIELSRFRQAKVLSYEYYSRNSIHTGPGSIEGQRINLRYWIRNVAMSEPRSRGLPAGLLDRPFYGRAVLLTKPIKPVSTGLPKGL